MDGAVRCWTYGAGLPGYLKRGVVARGTGLPAKLIQGVNARASGLPG